MAITTSYVKELKRGGFPALGAKVGIIEIDDIDISAAVSGDSFDLFTVESACQVLSASIEVKTETTNASTGDIGIKGGTTTLFGDGMALNATGLVQDATYPGPQFASADDVIQVSVEDADAGGTGSIRVVLVIADIEDLSGA
jgi:hypothetical protein